MCFIAINDKADVQDFSENGYEVVGLEQPIAGGFAHPKMHDPGG